jgi:putative FmdB family regulatory protein
MPLYEYKCDKCGSLFEVIQKFSDEPLSVHDNCGGAVERLVSAPAIQFKGSGWYITDYAKSGSTQPKSSGGKEPSATSSPSPSSAPASDSGGGTTSSSSPAPAASSGGSSDSGSKSS